MALTRISWWVPVATGLLVDDESGHAEDRDGGVRGKASRRSLDSLASEGELSDFGRAPGSGAGGVRLGSEEGGGQLSRLAGEHDHVGERRGALGLAAGAAGRGEQHLGPQDVVEGGLVERRGIQQRGGLDAALRRKLAGV